MTPEAIIAVVLFALVFLGLPYITLRSQWKIWEHPSILSLSLLGATGAILYFGSVEMAGRYGLSGLLAFMASVMVFMFAPLFQAPMRWISRSHHFSSLPDVLVYRFRGIDTGRISAVIMALVCLPLGIAQLKALSGVLLVISQVPQSTLELPLSLCFTAAAAVFVLRHTGTEPGRRSLPPVLAVGMLAGLAGLLAAGASAVAQVFGGYGGLESWLGQTGQYLTIRRFGSGDALILAFFVASLVLPQYVHLQSLWHYRKPAVSMASWCLPLLVLIATLPMFPLLWAGLELQLDIPLQYYVVALPMALDQPLITILVLLGGLVALTGTLAVMAQALAKPLANYLMAAHRKAYHDVNLQQWLQNWQKRFAVSWLAACLLLSVVAGSNSITDLTLVGLVGLAHLTPGLLATLYVPKINRKGFMAGLLAGTGVWTLGLLMPLFTGDWVLPWQDFPVAFGLENWQNWLVESLVINVTLMVLVSRFSTTSEEEKKYAHLSMVDNLPVPQRTELGHYSLEEAKRRLGEIIGPGDATQEIDNALRTLGLSRTDTRPQALRLLRDQLNRGLSFRMGTYIADRLVDHALPLADTVAGEVDDISLIESQLAASGSQLSGLAAELNKLRLYHRQTLENLPIGVCSIGTDGEILLWNNAMGNITGVSGCEIAGGTLDSLPAPWALLLMDFLAQPEPVVHAREVNVEGNPPAWFNLHKSNISVTSPMAPGPQIILLEDITERLLLVRELAHTERLTSVGRLAAGVAHEIGNPVTGISCLAQDLTATSGDKDVRATAETILQQTDRITRIVRSLIDFSRGDDNMEFSRVDIAQPVTEAIQLLELDKNARPVNYRNRLSPGLVVLGDSHQLTQVFLNLLANARDASSPEGEIEIRGELQDEMVCIMVEDRGAGIPDHLREKVVEPFFTTKDPGKGTGLGLSLVHTIIHHHRGEMDIKSPACSETRRGTMVIIHLPRT